LTFPFVYYILHEVRETLWGKELRNTAKTQHKTTYNAEEKSSKILQKKRLKGKGRSNIKGGYILCIYGGI
jgi:hypothetical protein